ncbi:MAG: primosomal protein N' [Alphaproteobacteria bacterium]|nr:primosomal protein N' [Alphaproteobacteria bacterium]
MSDPGARPVPAATAAPERVAVLLPLPLSGAYDYRVEPGMALDAGDFVAVPLGGREVIGVVWGPAAGDVAETKLKPVLARLDAPPMAESMRRFVMWIAHYTMSPPGAVLRMAMNTPAALAPLPPRIAYLRADGPVDALAARAGLRLTPPRRRVLDLMEDGPSRAPGEIAREAGVGMGVVKALIAGGALVPIELPAGRARVDPDWRRPPVALSEAQAAAADALRTKIPEGFSVTLLDGVTGAGKTEVYFEAIAAALARGHQALILLPEIALSAQWLERFERRFAVRPAEWHSDLTSAERRWTWRALAEGHARVVVGARSALFLPLPQLGLIVVDEEHDGAFKQEDGVVYQARDMAVVRAQLSHVPIILASATPSLETVVNVRVGRYDRIELPERHGAAGLPEVEIVDMKLHPPPRGRWLSPLLHQAIAAALGAEEQVLLFLNRRGYAPLTLCGSCGHRMQCPNCTAWLVEHRLAGRLQCHHCGHALPVPRDCPSCQAEGTMTACGPGIERVAEEVLKDFPEARFQVLASDTIGGPREAAEIMRAIHDREVDIVIGTQVAAKGHHFPWLTMVGVVDADLGLAGGDLRAAERTYQLLHQVAGRAGREERPGRVLLQTYMPNHPVIGALASGARDRFLALEAEARQEAAMPPFGRLVALIVSGPDGEAVDRVARDLGRQAPRGDDIAVFGPAPAPYAVLRGRQRRRLLLKAPRKTNVQAVIGEWLARVKTPNSVRIQVDVDPYSFL